MSREKARNQDRFGPRRVQRLAAAGVLSAHDDDVSAGALVEYMPKELVTVEGSVGPVQEELVSLGTEGRRRSGEQPGQRDDLDRAPVILVVDGDPIDLARRINASRGERGEAELPVAPNYVLSVGQRTKIGPGSDPWPADPGERPFPGPAVADAPTVGIVDTGRWEPMPFTIPDPGGAADEDPIDTTPQDQRIDYPGAGHGGFIAGIINHTADGIQIVLRRGYRANSQDIMTEDSVVAAGNAVVAANARILNLSLGTYAANPIILRDAVRGWVEAGFLVVAAAGNDGTAQPWVPGRLRRRSRARPRRGVGGSAGGEGRGRTRYHRRRRTLLQPWIVGDRLGPRGRHRQRLPR